MKFTDDDLRAIWQQGSTDVPSDRSACLTEVELARLMAKEANDEEGVRAADHIGSCTQCAEEYRLLLPLQSWASEVQQAFPRDKKADRNDLTSWPRWFAVRRPAVALAAALLVLQAVPLYLMVGARRQNAELEARLAEEKHVLSLAQESLAALHKDLAQDKDTFSATRTSLAALQEELRRRPAPQTADQLDGLQQRLAQLSTPQLDAAIVNLNPLDAPRRPSAGPGAGRPPASREQTGKVQPVDPPTVTIHPNVSHVTLILKFAPLLSRSILEVEVRDQSGHALWVDRTERDRSTGSLTLALPTDGYPAGRYEIYVFDVTHGRTPFATYAVMIRAPQAKSP